MDKFFYEQFLPHHLAAAREEMMPACPVDLSRAKKIAVTRDTYQEAEAKGLNLSELLESEVYDPSPPEAPLDAFERQLAVHGLRVGGRNPITVELFARQAPGLLPEFMRREIRRGQAMRPELDQLIGSTSRVATNRYTPFAVDASPSDTDYSLRPIGDGANVPTMVVTEALHSVDVPDYGLGLKASYKSLRHRTAAQFKVILWYIGYRLQVDKLGLLTDVLINGDGNSNSATVVNTAASGTLAYDDLVTFWDALYPFEMNTILCASDKIKTILTMTEFKDPLAGFKFQATGELVSPLGAKLVRSDEVPTDVLVGFDRRFAIEEVVTQPLTIEYDKIIEQRFEEAVIVESVAYAKVIKDAAKVLDTVWV